MRRPFQKTEWPAHDSTDAPRLVRSSGSQPLPFGSAPLGFARGRQGRPFVAQGKRAGLAVRFQQVVHSSRTGEADCVQQSTSTGDTRMDIHKNARLTFVRREQLAEKVILQGSTLNSAAAEFNVCARTAAKWTRRYRQQGPAGLPDRSSRPLRSPRRTADALVQRVEQLRRPAHRSGHRPESRHRQPHPSPTGSESHPRPGARCARDSLRAPPLPAICSISISNIWAVLLKWSFEPMGAGAGSIIVGGSISTSPLTITPAWPSPRSCPTSPALPQLLFFTLPWPITPLWAFAFAGCSPTTATATARALSARLACNSAFAITLRAPTHLAPTGKLNASSKPPSANGFTPARIKTPSNVTRRCLLGFITTTGIALVVVSTTLHLSAALA